MKSHSQISPYYLVAGVKTFIDRKQKVRDSQAPEKQVNGSIYDKIPGKPIKIEADRPMITCEIEMPIRFL